MDAIFTVVLFSVPGFIANILEDRLFNKITRDKTQFDKTVPAVVYSSLIMILNMITFDKFLNIKIKTFGELIKRLSNIDFYFKYIVVTFFTCIIFVFFKKYIWESLILFLINKWRKFNNLSVETKFSTVWEEIFDNPEKPIMDKIISIEKDGNIITSGVLERYSTYNGKHREFLLIETNETREYLNDTKNLLSKIDMEYYDQDSGHLIKFYNTDELYEYLRS